MRPTLNVNLGGLQFIFNDNAYRLMNEYLQSLGDAFRTQGLDAYELCADIETRCAEILSEAHDRNTYIVTEGDITAIIDRMGRPEEILDEQADEGRGFEQAHVKDTVMPPPYAPNKPLRKRLYRVKQGSELGGVCGGIAAYCGWDPTYVRIATVLLAILSASTVSIAYLVLWIVVPQAKTPLQEMELRGESPTLNNIGRTVKQVFGFKEDTEQPHQASGAPFEKLNTKPEAMLHCSRTARFFAMIAKILLGFIGLICSVITIGLLIASIGGVIWGITMLILPEYTVPYFYFKQLGIVFCGTIIIGIPLSLFVWWIIRFLFNLSSKRTISPSWRLTLFVVWTITLLVCIKFMHVYSSEIVNF